MVYNEDVRYIQAFAGIIGVKEDAVVEYVRRKGITSLVDNASQLLTSSKQREKHRALLDLYRISNTLNSKNPIIDSSERAVEFFHSVVDTIHDKETFVVAFLNTRNRLIGYEIVSVGTVDSTMAHPREVFRGAIVNKATGVILCHNHPSGDITPSADDRQTTQRLKEAGELLGIAVLDHVIISGLNRKVFSSVLADTQKRTPVDR